MFFSPLHPEEPSLQSSDIPYGVDDDLVPSFAPFDSLASVSAHPCSQNELAHVRFSFPEPSFSADEIFCFPSRAYAQPQPPWNNTLPRHDLSLSPLVHGPSKPFPRAASNVLEDDTAIISGHSTLSREQRNNVRGSFPIVTISAPPDERGTQAGPHPAHVLSWLDACRNAVIVNGPRTFVPQAIYQPQAQGDRERYVIRAVLQPPIIFITQGSPEWGIPIQCLLSKQPIELIGGDEPAFVLNGPSIGIRLQWPGYQPCHKQVPIRDYARERRIISKGKLAKVVARCIKQFMDDMDGQTMQVGSDMQWRVGPHDIWVNDIILVSLHHVSQGSWQPQLLLRKTVGAVQGYRQPAHGTNSRVPTRSGRMLVEEDVPLITSLVFDFL